MPSRYGFLVAAALGVMACAPADADRTDVVRTDSAGVRIITSLGDDRELPWRFDTVGIFRDSLGEPWIFEGLGNDRVVTDRLGRTYVLVSDPAVVQFGRDGSYLRSLGRKGGGPGEMEYPTALRVQGDSLAVLDHERNVLVRWGPSLESISDLPLRGALTGAYDLAFRNGGVWVQGAAFGPDGTRNYLSPDTTGGGTLMEVTSPRGTILRACNFAISLPPLFGPELHWATVGPRLIATSGPEYDLRLFEGPRPLASIRRDLSTRAPTVDDIGRLYPEGFRLTAPGGPSCTFPNDLIASAGLADAMPFVFGLTILSDGTVWVQRSLRSEPPVLDVFGPDGAYVGTVRGLALPVGLLPNGELLVPVEDEESGGQHLVRFTVVR